MSDQTSSQFAADQEETAELDLRKYLGVVVRRKWTILAVAALGVAAAAVWTLQQTKIYRSTATVVVNPQAPRVFGKDVQEVVQLGAGNYWSNKEYYNTQIQILEGYDLAEETVRRYDLHENTDLLPAAAAEDLSPADKIQRASERLSGSLTASHLKDSRILQVHVDHPKPEFAADVANKHVDTYISNNLDLRSEPTDDAAKFLSRELDRAEDQLRSSENELYDFKKQNEILSVSLEDKLNLIASNLERYSGALADSRVRRIKLQTRLDRAREALESGKPLQSPIFALTDTEAGEELKKQYLSEKKSFLEIEQQLGPKNPEYIAQDKKVDELYAAIEREAHAAMKKIEEQYQAAQEAENKFRAEVERLKKRAFELGPKTIAFNRLKRQRKADEANYEIVTDRLRASELSSRNTLGNIHEGTSARGGVLVEPKLEMNLAIAGFASLLLGLGLAVGLEYLDRTVKTSEEVEQATGVPLLGPIPIVDEVPAGTGDDANRDRDLYVYKHPTSRTAECCRSIRTNILFSSAAREIKTLMVSSPNPKEGKTLSAVYLGTTMAQGGQRVLLVDTDMRKPRLHKSMGVARGRGIASLLLGESSYDEAIKTTDVPNLFVLPCGPTPPNPGELLLSSKFKEIMADLQERYDMVIFDSPPMQAVTDAVVLGRLTDGVILIAKSSGTVRDDLGYCAKRLRDVNAHIVGVVLNNLDLSNKKYGYYYYEYNYGDQDNKADATAT